MFSFLFFLSSVAFLLFGLDPLVKVFTGESNRVIRSAQPKIDWSKLALEPLANETLNCPQDAYSVHIYSREPLVMVIEDFISPEERKHLLEISEPLFEPSTLTKDGATTYSDKSVRDSEVAVIPRTEIVKCIETRARSIQGWREDMWIERLRVQRYGLGGHYSHHYDWTRAYAGWGRVSSFMVYVDDDNGQVEGGATEFPRLARQKDPRWCKFTECGDDAEVAERDGHSENDGLGVSFKPKAGVAVFWENFRSDGTGRGYDETWHAGLPVTRGRKVGLNIWSFGRLA